MGWYISSISHLGEFHPTKNFYNAIYNSFLLSSFVTLLTILISLSIYKALILCKRKIEKLAFTISIITFLTLSPLVLLVLVKNTPILAWLPGWMLAGVVLIPWELSLFIVFLFPILSIREKRNSRLFFSAVFGDRMTVYIREILVPANMDLLFAAVTIVFMTILMRQDIPSILGFFTFGEYILTNVMILSKPADELGAFASLVPVVIVCISVIGVLLYKKSYSVMDTSNYSVYDDIFNDTDYKENRCRASSILLKIMALAALSIIIFIAKKSLPALEDPQIIISSIKIYFSSIAISFLASVMILFIVHIVFYFIRKIKELRFFFDIFSLLMFATPKSMIAIGTLYEFGFLSQTKIIGEYGMFFIAYFYYAFPIGWFLVRAENLFSNRENDEWIKPLKISKTNRFLNITLPIRYKYWIMEIVLLTLWIYHALDLPLLLAPPGFETAVVRIYNLLHYSALHQVAFIGLLPALTALTIAGLIFVVKKVNS